MRRLKPAIFATVVTAAALSLGGCATKDYVNQQVSAEDNKVQANQTQTNQHLSQLDQSTKDALERATAAGKLAEGKFLYSMVLSDDSVKFPVDSAKLSPEAEQRLSDFADKLKSDNRNVYLEIQGHTDAKGPDPLNEQLGEKRAAKNRDTQKNQDRLAWKHVATATIAWQKVNIVRNGCSYLGTIRRHRSGSDG